MYYNVSMRRKSLLAVVVLFGFSSVAFAGWNSLASGTAQDLNAVFFVTTSLGYAAGANGAVIKTSTAGTTFESQIVGTGAYNDVVYPAAAEGYLLGDSGKLYNSTDGGTTYSLMPLPAALASAGFRRGSFSGTNRAFAAYTGADSYLYYSTDSGASFSAIPVPGYEIYGVTLTSASTFEWAISAAGTYTILKNGTAVYTDASRRIRDIFFVDSDPSVGYAVGSSGTILKTIDSGASWSAQTSGVTANLNAVFFVSFDVGWAVGDSGTVLFTSDSGATWSSYSDSQLDFTKNINDLFIKTTISGSNLTAYGFAAGNGGKVYKLTSPAVYSISPSSKMQGWMGPVEVTGSGFFNGAQAEFSGSGITVITNEVASTTSFKPFILIDGAAPAGARDLTITNADLTSVVTAAAFTVTAGNAAVSIRNVWLDGSKYLPPAPPPRTTCTPTPNISFEAASTAANLTGAAFNGVILTNSGGVYKRFSIPAGAVTFSGTNAASVSYTLPESIATGTANFWIKIEDAAGNVGSFPMTLYVAVPSGAAPPPDAPAVPGVDKPEETVSVIPQKTKTNLETEKSIGAQLRLKPGVYLPQGFTVRAVRFGKIIYTKSFPGPVVQKLNFNVPIAELSSELSGAGILTILVTDNSNGKLIGTSKVVLVGKGMGN